MNDPLKKYIQDHREEFDTLEVPDETFDKIMSRLNESTNSVEKTIPLFPWKKWMAAASAVIVFGVGSYTLWNQKGNERSIIAAAENPKRKGQNSVEIINQENVYETLKVKTAKKKNTSNVFVNNNSNHSEKSIDSQHLIQIQSSENEKENDFDETQALELINNEQSASSRLEGIAMISNFSPLDEKLIILLSEKAISDENTNVRLAAVSVLEIQKQNPAVMNRIQQIFVQQNDPMVQKELISFLAEKQPSEISAEVNIKLIALARDPTTADYVKDEAYAVLMKY